MNLNSPAVMYLPIQWDVSTKPLQRRSGYRYHFRQDGRRSASETASFASRMEMEKGLCLHQPIPSRVASRLRKSQTQVTWNCPAKDAKQERRSEEGNDPQMRSH